MRQRSYEVCMVNRKGEEVRIYGPTSSLWAARTIAQKQNPRRKVKIYRDQKLMPGGRAGLDSHAYALWLEEAQDA